MTTLATLAHLTGPELGWGLGLLTAGALVGACIALAVARRARR